MTKLAMEAGRKSLNYSVLDVKNVLSKRYTQGLREQSSKTILKTDTNCKFRGFQKPPSDMIILEKFTELIEFHSVIKIS